MELLAVFRKRFQRKVSLLLCTAFFFSIGGHWYALQAAAWGKMITEYAKDRGIKNALVLTLNGQNPCELCHYVEKGRTQQDSSAQPQIENKIKDAFIASIQVDTAHFPEPTPSEGYSVASFESWAQPPPVPPPQASI